MILIASFAIGALVNGFTSSRNDKAKKAHGVDEEVPAAVATTSSSPTSTIADLNLVPATSTETVASTTLPPLVDPDHQYQPGYQGGDATAMSAQQYARMTQAPMVTTTPTATVNPLSVPPTPAVPTTPPPSPRPRPAPPREVAMPERHVERTDAVPISQPLPDIDTSRLRHDANFRFNLTIGTDGRVKEVEIIKGAEGLTAKMISKIQSWRFKPATADGRPVESHFPVDISFNAP